MEKMLTAIGASALVTATLLVPVSAFAYLSPDQVFGGSSLTVAPAPSATTSTTQTTAQPTTSTQSQTPTAQQIPDQVNRRNAEDVVSIQQQNSAALRTEAQQSLVSTQADPVDTYVPPTQTATLGLFDQNAQYAKRQDRIATQRANAPTIIIGGNGDVVDSNGNVLHSGAPRVTQTGPETTLAFIAMILAAACTFAYAEIRSRRQRVLAA